MHAGPVLRPYRAADLDAVIGVFLGAIRQVAARDYSPDQIAAWAQADRHVWEKRCLGRPTWVATLDSGVVGFSDLEAGDHLDMMYVHPAYQRLGVATRLLGQVEKAALDLGASCFLTESSLTALPFFEASGFEVIERQQVSLRGKSFANVRMRKRLGGVRAPGVAVRDIG